MKRNAFGQLGTAPAATYHRPSESVKAGETDSVRRSV